MSDHATPLLNMSERLELDETMGVYKILSNLTLFEWLPVFMSRGSGHIVAISSIAGLMGTKNLVPYCASKFAIRGLMEGLKEELRSDNRYLGSIKLTCVHPFVVDTGLAQTEPKIRFPSFNPITPPELAAEIILEGMLRDEYFISIPRKDFYFFRLASVMSLDVQHAVNNFLKIEVIEHEDNS